ncbi:MAG TPA: PH domain-containing protein [Thermoanaerobaculia bacterium]|nr:PH domain-containing protein [Thermoanaerobaculia bacterium]
MTGGIKAFLCRVFKVPPQPDPPPGDSASSRIFRAGKNYFRYKLILWGISHIMVLATLATIIPVMLFNTPEDSGLRTVMTAIAVVLIIAFPLSMLLSFFILRLDFEMRWYIVTDRSLRIREGILSVREKTITFANIQNMTVRQGPVQRLLGLADLEVSTAGGGGGDPSGKKGVGEDQRTGYFRGVDNAEEIRERIERGVRRHQGAGLGDREDQVSEASTQGAVDAARRVLDEIRALKTQATRTLGP